MSAPALPAVPAMPKAKKRPRPTGEWTWDDEMLMYDVTSKEAQKRKRIMEKESMTEEAKRLKKEQRTASLYAKEERKLFLGGLSLDTVEKDLRRHFEQFGQLIDVQVMRDRQSGVSRGFGFVAFACSFMAEAALEHPGGHVINGKEIQPQPATPDAPRFKKTIPEMERELDEECQFKRSIFVGALKERITEDDLTYYFSAFGKVLRAVKLTDKQTGEKTTTGFVDFAEHGVVRKIMNVTKHFIKGKRIRVDISRPRIEFSHQTKTVTMTHDGHYVSNLLSIERLQIFVGGLEDGIDDPELHRYFSEFGFVVRALRIPNKDEPKRKFGFVDFDSYEAVDIVVSQKDHHIEGHRVRVELALPMLNDSLYEKDVVTPDETWQEKVERKLRYAVPDQGLWGETLNNYEIFVQGGSDVKTAQFKVPRGMLEYVVGMAGKVAEEIANDSHTRIQLFRPRVGAKTVVFSVTGKKADVDTALFIFQKIVKHNMHKLNMVRPITNS